MNSQLLAFKFYRKVCSESLNSSLVESSNSGCRSKVFNSCVTIWLMIFQRLNADHSLNAAIEEFRSGTLSDLVDFGSIKIRSGKISGFTGGYSHARARIPLSTVENTSDSINEALIKSHKHQLYKGRRIFLVDGSTLRIPYTDKNLQSYPQYKNQHGFAHYPLVRFSILTDAVSGVCLRPAYGPYNGSKATNELSLFEELLPRIPENSVIIGDRFYGCPRFAQEAISCGHDVICRVKTLNAKRFIGIPKGSGSLDVDWNSNRSKTGNSYAVKGRFVWSTLRKKGYRPKFIVLFTTLDLSVKEIVKMYDLRWNVELDIRSIKSTMDMNMLMAKSPDMIAKELILGITAYNLIRHIMITSAKILKLTPREISFSKVLKRVRSIHTTLIETGLSKQTNKALLYLLTDVISLKLPKRKTPKTLEPRKTWPKGQRSHMTTSRELERQKLIDKNNDLNALQLK